MPMPPKLGQYLGEVFPSSRVAQDSGVGFSVSGGVLPPPPPPVRAMTAAEPKAAREVTKMVLASILIVVCLELDSKKSARKIEALGSD